MFVGCHSKIHLLEGGTQISGSKTVSVGQSPPDDRGGVPGELVGGALRKADRGHGLGEFEGRAQGQNGDVIKCIEWVVPRMHGDLGDGSEVQHRVSGVVLSDRHLDLSRVQFTEIEWTKLYAVGRGEDVLAGDDGSATHGGFVENADKVKHNPDLPGILMDLRLCAANDPRCSVSHATVAVYFLGTIWQPRKYLERMMIFNKHNQLCVISMIKSYLDNYSHGTTIPLRK